MLASVTLEVASRYTGNNLGGSGELARLSMVMLVFMSLPALAHHSGHIRLDVVSEKVKSKVVVEWVHRCALLAELTFLVVLTGLAYEFVSLLADSTQQTPSLGIRLFWFRLPLLVGAALGAVVSACVLLRRLINPPGADLDESAEYADIMPAI